MKVILLNDDQRKRIIEKVQPSLRNMYSYQNLDLLTAVLNEKTGNILTLTYYLSAAIKRTDETNNDYRFILLTDKGDVTVSWYEGENVYVENSSPISKQISTEEVKELIAFYENRFSERWDMRMMEEKKLGLKEKKFTEWYLEKELPGEN